MARKHTTKHFHSLHAIRNILIFVAGITAAVILAKDPGFTAFIYSLHQFQYLGAFVAGMLFVFTPTVGLGAVLLSVLVRDLPAIPLALAAGAGAMVTNDIMFRFFRHEAKAEAQKLTQVFGKYHLLHLVHSKFFHWTLPVVGAVLITLPLPDEMGVSLLGVSKLTPLEFTTLSFMLHTIGILLTISAGTLLSR